jgi:hypothetical protein
MLSSGKWHEQVPRDPKKNVALRKRLLKAARGDAGLQALLMQKCRDDILLWINLFVVQHNPIHLGDEIGPFITWAEQERDILYLVESVERQEDCRVEKSREMGATWIMMIVVVWLTEFHDNKNALLLSKDENAVDMAGDPKALFWKIDFINKYLPEWMSGLESGNITRRKNNCIFNRTGGYVTGAASVKSAGVGGRYTLGPWRQHRQHAKITAMVSGRTASRARRFFVIPPRLPDAARLVKKARARIESWSNSRTVA